MREMGRDPSAVPSGLVRLLPDSPNLERLGYRRASLRDEEQSLLVLEPRAPLGRAQIKINSRFRGFHLLDHLAKLFKSNVLDLTDAFPGHAKLLTDFFECLLRSAIQAEAGAQDG